MIKKLNMKTTVIATTTVAIIVNFLAVDVFASTDADYSFRLTSDWHDCQQIGAAYQEVYAFETDTAFMSISAKKTTLIFTQEKPNKVTIAPSLFLRIS